MSAGIRSANLRILRAGGATFPPECLEYLYRLIHRACFAGEGYRDLPAAELCSLFRMQVGADFGIFADDVLHRWGLRNHGDLGSAVFLLAENGCLVLREGETREDYEAQGPIRIG